MMVTNNALQCKVFCGHTLLILYSLHSLTRFSSAPNAYSIGATKNAPSYSLSARTPELKKFLTPAPGNYEVGS